MVITSVTPKSPAGRADLKPGDHLLAVDGPAIRTWEDWRRFVARREIGHDYRFEIERDGQRTELNLTLGRQPGDPWLRLERKRYVQFFLLLLALVLAMQLLALWPAARGAIVAIDAVLLLGGVGVLWSTTPLRHWPTVMIFGATALWEWHVGWLTAREETA